MKILVADDSQSNLILLSVALKDLGHTVVAVTDSEQAIEEFKRSRPDLIILDVVMSGMSGFECARRIRAINTEDWIPIIFLSTAFDDASIAEGIDAGGDDYLSKPFSKTRLAAKVKAMQRISDMRNKLYETSQQLAVLTATDTLSGIYNRFQFDKTLKEKIAEADKSNSMLALLFFDLDNFKSINDSFGHQVGDLLIKEIARRLKSSLRANDFVARIGGDEFAIILPDIENKEVAGHLASKILEILTPDYYLENYKIRIGASIGIACYPFSGTTPDTIVKHADIAMYYAKELGRNNFQYYSEDLKSKYKMNVNLEHDLRFALEKKELYLTYQPIFELQTKEMVAVEALLCWEHPIYGMISPNVFIPIAEHSGLIADIGSWVFNTACEQAQQWALDKRKDFKVAINISTQQLVQSNFYNMIIETLANYNLSPSLIEIELTETSLMDYSVNFSQETIQKFHEKGFSIAIDDFGTGYSSFLRLKNLKIDTLKIDQLFVRDILTNPNDAIIVDSIIDMSRNLGLKVVIEGIETEAQLEYLISKGCKYGQGYLLARSMKVDEMTSFLKLHKKNDNKG